MQAYIDFIKIILYYLGKLPLYLKSKNNSYTTYLIIRELYFLRENFLNISTNLLQKKLLNDLIVYKKNSNILIKKKQQRKNKKYSFIFGEVNNSSFKKSFVNSLIQSKLKSFYIKLLKKVSIYTKEWLKKKKLNIKKKSIKQLLLNVTFKKRNTFFNVSEPYGKTIHLTTVRQAGYVGRRRKEYNSIFSVTRLVRKVISKHFSSKYHGLTLVYKGWSRFRSAVRKALNTKSDKLRRLKIRYIKYVINIPHNGCRPQKRRNRSKLKFYKKKKQLKKK